MKHSKLSKKHILGMWVTPVWTKAPLPCKKDEILLASDVVALKEVKKKNVTNFIRVNIIYHFDIPHYIITDNGKPFDNRLMNKVCDLFGFKQHNSSMYNVVANVIQKGITDEENARLRLAELEALDEKRLEAQQSLEYYHARLSLPFNKRVRPRSFQVGDQVLSIRRLIITSHKLVGKFTSKWDKPYVVQQDYSSGSHKLVDADGMIIRPVNGKFLKKYYP
ncbi:uncharacterized protein [Nicotiana sylvestris]|uniref:uncharacterized protein n=1 Tax=Nicotiana sylvestris TaxID=4096 RepID=UPI00388CB9A2